MKFFRSTICLAMALGHAHADTFEDAARLKNTGNVQAVYDLLDRVNPGSKDHFTLSLSGKWLKALLHSSNSTFEIGIDQIVWHSLPNTCVVW